MIHIVFGILLTITGIFDAIKYYWQAKKIREIETAKGHSRKFINAAITNDLVRIIYFILVSKDIYLIISAAIALICMVYLHWTIYVFYPYRYRGLSNFKKPPLYVFIINSIIPNNYRRRL